MCASIACSTRNSIDRSVSGLVSSTALCGRTRLVLPSPTGAGEVDACTFLEITGCAHTVGQCRAPRWRDRAAGARFAHAIQRILARAAFHARAAVGPDEAGVADTRRDCSAPGR